MHTVLSVNVCVCVCVLTLHTCVLCMHTVVRVCVCVRGYVSTLCYLRPYLCHLTHKYVFKHLTQTVVFSKLSGGTQWRPLSGPQWHGKITSRHRQGSPHVWEDSWWPKKTPRPLRPPSPWWDEWHGFWWGDHFHGVWSIYVIIVLWEGVREGDGGGVREGGRERDSGGERGRREREEREKEKVGGRGSNHTFMTLVKPFFFFSSASSSSFRINCKHQLY